MTRTRVRAWIAALAAASAVVIVGASADPLPQDVGAAGTWQKLLKLKTTASAMHTTAHPDDEHGGVLAWMSRGLGARVSLLTLNRGESGDNAIGPELFDAVGLIRTEELLDADQYYGVDRQYFTTVVDYGFSKRLDEALEKWGRDNVLRDVVRIIRMDRPLVLVARFQGNERDGHGNHQTAGLITRDAYKAAGDPAMFPEQIREGLRPWAPLKLYMGGVRANEDWTIRTDAGEYSPWLGYSYSDFSRLGLAFQRSQNGGRVSMAPGPAYGYYKRLASHVEAPDKEQTFFDGIDTTIPGLFTALGRPAPAIAPALLGAIQREVDAAVRSFSEVDPAACVPALARGLKATRAAIEQLSGEPDAVFVLRVKERQFEDAISTALGVALTAVAQPANLPEPTGAFAAFAPPPLMGPVVPGQTFEVRAAFTNRGRAPMSHVGLALDAPQSWTVTGAAPETPQLPYNATDAARFVVHVPGNAEPTRPYFSRKSLNDVRYTINNPRAMFKPAADPVLLVSATYSVDGVPVDLSRPVERRESNLPYGIEMRELTVAPAISVVVTPRQAVVPIAKPSKTIPIDVALLNNDDGGSAGSITLKLPAGWSATPASQPFSFARAGERGVYRFTVNIPSLGDQDYEIAAVASAGDRSFTSGYDVIQHRDLETRYLWHDARTAVRGVDVTVPPLRVGYVMGIGDEVPQGIAQLGASVQLLGEQDLASGNLQQFDAIMTGTRAYAVREDLKTYNQRLLDYVKDGGNLIVLYNTQEFVPDKYAPYKGQLPQDAEEVSEEDSPVEILAPDAVVLNKPNTITKADFDGWVEQRGSKFFSQWDPAYTPIIATWDKGQAPQKGGWLTARYGKGHYTYFAYAFHRQLPYGVPGAFRLLANVLSLSKTDP